MRNTVAVLMIAVLAGCEYNNLTYKEKEPVVENYLPLKIGNYWNFQTTSHSQGQSSTQIHREVASIVTINNHEYYLLVTSSTNNSYTYQDSSYYRIDSNGFVYIYRKSNPNFEDNRFRLNGDDHDTWSYPVEGSEQAHITLTVESVTLDNIELNKCKSYFYDVTQWADEEYTIILAPGIGFVKEYSNAWGLGQILKSARIDGQVFNF
jgi:hypothetical protein